MCTKHAVAERNEQHAAADRQLSSVLEMNGRGDLLAGRGGLRTDGAAKWLRRAALPNANTRGRARGGDKTMPLMRFREPSASDLAPGHASPGRDARPCPARWNVAVATAWTPIRLTANARKR